MSQKYKKRGDSGMEKKLGAGGGVAILETSGLPIISEAEKMVGFLGIDRDITKRKRAERKIKSFNKILEQKVKIRTKELKRLNEHLAQSENQMRNKIASDLHDSVVQTLAISIFKLKNIKVAGKPFNLEEISKIEEYLELSMMEIKSLVYQISPPILDDFEIDTILEFLIEENNKTHNLNIKYIKHIDNPVHIDKTKRILVYRVISELITNIRKHSGSKDAEIEISKSENLILLRIEDAGVGFDQNKYTNKNFCGFGIYSISERIENLGGNFSLFSKPNVGTKILFSIPLL
jgi:signal transduction histidine kinase